MEQVETRGMDKEIERIIKEFNKDAEEDYLLDIEIYNEDDEDEVLY